jgi:hypothetical protein
VIQCQFGRMGEFQTPVPCILRAKILIALGSSATALENSLISISAHVILASFEINIVISQRAYRL